MEPLLFEVYASLREISGPLVVLLDYLMPDMSGTQVQERLRTYDPDVRTVLFTAANVNEQNLKIWEKYAFKRILQKPQGVAELESAITYAASV